MKKTILSAVLLLTTSILTANTTMCFKENHQSMSTIEKTKLDGGECKSLFSVEQMKTKGWIIDDIKINPGSNGMNYIYIFKHQTSNISNSFQKNESQDELESRIIAKLEKKKEEEKKTIELEKKIKAENKGKDKYIATCQKCHGAKGEIAAYNVSRPLKDLSLEEINESMRDYRLNLKDNGFGIVMTAYAKGTNSQAQENIYNYLQKLNN